VPGAVKRRLTGKKVGSMAFQQFLVRLYKRAVRDLKGHGLGRFRIVQTAKRHAYLTVRAKSAVVDGHPMFLDAHDILELSINGIYEPVETALAKSEVKPGNTVLDIGAHVGYYTLMFARLVGPGGRVYAFEPEPANFAVLTKNVETNGYRNVRLIHQAVSNRNTKTRLFLADYDLGDHRIYDSGDNRESIEIDLVRLDDFFGERGSRIDFLKMDVQGSEAGVLLGMPRLLEQNPQIKIVTEFWPFGLTNFGTDPAEFLRLLAPPGRKLYHVSEELGRIEPADVRQLLETYTVEKKNYTNLLSVPEEWTGAEAVRPAVRLEPSF
jgi:FkbM family methyltransferase